MFLTSSKCIAKIIKSFTYYKVTELFLGSFKTLLLAFYTSVGLSPILVSNMTVNFQENQCLEKPKKNNFNGPFDGVLPILKVTKMCIIPQPTKA